MDPIRLLLEPLQFDFMRLALAEAGLVGALCGAVGAVIVLRRLAFLADAIPHFIFPGVVLALAGGVDPLLGGLVAALLAVGIVGRLARGRGLREDAAVGIVFVGVFSLGVVLVSRARNYATSLSSLLFGDILAVQPLDLLITAGVALVVVATVWALWKEVLLVTFDPLVAAAGGLPVGRLDLVLLGLVALAIVTSVPAVGNTLVVGLLVTPAATARLLTRRLPAMLLLGSLLGALSGLIGLYMSYWLGLASGATMTVTASAFFLLAWLVGPRGGALWRLRRPRHAARDPFASEAAS